MSAQVRQFIRGEAGKDHPFILWGEVEEDGSCCGELVASFDWEESGGYMLCSLQICSDAFRVFRSYADVFVGLGELPALGLTWSVEEAADFLRSLGFTEVLPFCDVCPGHTIAA